MLMVNTQEDPIIIKLKSHFYDLIDTESGLFHYDHIVNKMLTAIHSLLEVPGILLYKRNEQEQVLQFKAPMGNIDVEMFPKKIDIRSIPDFSRSGAPMNRTSLIEIEGNALMLLLEKENQLLGCLIFEGNDQEFHISEDVLQVFANECGHFLAKIQELSTVLSEEKRYQQLFRVTEKFHSSMSMDSVLGEIIQTLQEVYPTFTYYLLLSHDNNNNTDLPIKDLEYDSENISAMQAYVTGTIQFEDSQSYERSVLYAPLMGKQGVYGVLQVIAPNTVNFPKNEVEFISLLANTAGSALENAQLYQQSKRLISDLQLINETSHRLNSDLRLTETMKYMSEQISSSFGAEEVGFILLLNDGEDINVLQGSTSFFQVRESERYIHLMKDKIAKEREPLFLGDFHFPDSTEEKGFKSIMAVPMDQSGELKGFALVMHQQPYHFSFESFKLLQSLIHHSTLAFTNSMLREELERMVVTDHLTKLFSRSYLDKKIYSSMNEDQEGTFMLIDIDNFKKVNDTYGHQAGDEVIVQVANLIRKNIRGSDIGARWGGEELAVYLPNVGLEVGIAIANRLVQKVGNTTNPHVTISCGVSYWSKASITDVQEEDTYSALFKRADKALYIAKETGKNKMVVQKN